MKTTVETKTCKLCNTSFNITDKDIEFLEKISPVFAGKKYQIPTPTLCPQCRKIRRLSWRNERKLYKGICSRTRKNIVSQFSLDKNFTAYSSDEWWSDRWNPLDYGKDFDFNRSFFEQMKELMDTVPKLSLINFNSENSDYTNISADNKNCYLIVESSNNEDSMYSYWLQLSKNIVDCAYVNNSSICYQCTNIENSYNLKFCQRCIDCKESYFLKDSEGCTNCFACKSLQGKKYFIFNKETTESQYKEIVNIFLHGTKDEKNKLTSQVQAFFEGFGPRPPRIIMSENCSGDFILNSKDCIDVFESNDAENCRHCTDVWRNSKDAMDANTFGRNAQIGYEVLNTGIDVYNILFSALCWINDRNIMYSYYCTHSDNLFGCVGIHSPHSYCILNKQYTQEAYEILVPKIIEHMMKMGEWGEFFPSNISPFGYNETVAMEYFPLTREDVLGNFIETGCRERRSAFPIPVETKDISSGCSAQSSIPVETRFIASDSVSGGLVHGPIFNWSDYEAPFPKVEKMISADKLPDDISKIPDDILNWAIQCEITQKPFKIMKQELAFYRSQGLPIPKLHPDERHIERMHQKNI